MELKTLRETLPEEFFTEQHKDSSAHLLLGHKVTSWQNDTQGTTWFIENGQTVVRRRNEDKEVEYFIVTPPPSKEQLEILAESFNQTYCEAAVTSDSDAYFEAALAGRRLVNALEDAGILDDNFNSILKEVQEKHGEF